MSFAAVTPARKRFPWKNVPSWSPLYHKLQLHSTTSLHSPAVDTLHAGSDSRGSTEPDLDIKGVILLFATYFTVRMIHLLWRRTTYRGPTQPTLSSTLTIPERPLSRLLSLPSSLSPQWPLRFQA